MGTAARNVWAIKVVIEATAEDADKAIQAIGRTLCPQENHSGECAVPWTTVLCVLDQLDPSERAAWSASFADDRERTQQIGATDDE